MFSRGKLPFDDSELAEQASRLLEDDSVFSQGFTAAVCSHDPVSGAHHSYDPRAAAQGYEWSWCREGKHAA